VEGVRDLHFIPVDDWEEMSIQAENEKSIEIVGAGKRSRDFINSGKYREGKFPAVTG